MSIIDRIKQLKTKKAEDAERRAEGSSAVSPKKRETAPVEKQKKDVAPAEKTVAVKKTGNAYRVLLRPHLSEKAVARESGGTYTFVVHPSATKHAVQDAVLRVYGVAPARVRMMNMEGKIRRFGRMTGRRSDWKKAIVTLPKGKTISIHEGV